MFKHIIAILILSAVLLQTFSKVIIVADYWLNKDYIAKNLCEKKDVVNNCCKGKCHLKKQLEQDDKKEQAPVSKNFKDKNEMQFFSESKQANFLFVPEVTVLKFFDSSSEITPVLFSVFHPPKC